MKYLIAQGSSINKIFCHCSICGKQQTWIKLYELQEGHYEAICSRCMKTLKNSNY